MYFEIPYQPYIAIIGDIKDSKKIINRYEVQENLKNILENINENYSADLASKFIVTLGDEFQGLLKNGAAVMPIIWEIEREFYPEKIRFGIGVGEIYTTINYELAIGSDGPCYYKAREAISYLKENERKKGRSKPLIRLEVDKLEKGPQKLINTILSLMDSVKSSWTERQFETISDLERYNDGQTKVARRLGIKQSSVQRILSNANYYLFKEAFDMVVETLSEIRASDV